MLSLSLSLSLDDSLEVERILAERSEILAASGGGDNSLVNQFDRFRQNLDLAGSMQGVDDFRMAAFDLLTSAKIARAFDLSREPDEIRNQYGRHRWGQNCLLARRLAESGAAVINVDATAPSDESPNFSWDDHAGPFHLVHANLERFPLYDQAITALIEDIHQRGLSEKILVVA